MTSTVIGVSAIDWNVVGSAVKNPEGYEVGCLDGLLDGLSVGLTETGAKEGCAEVGLIEG